jgi:hypothetical protein
MKFIDNDLSNHIGTDFKVFKRSDGITILEFSDGKSIFNELNYNELFLGRCNTCTSFYKDSFNGFTYDKVLVAGLGFGLIPQELSEVNNCSQIDVVEINQELIDYNISSNHLNTDINIIQSDIFDYTTVERYDLIIIDTIWDESEMNEEQYQSLVSRFYNTNLNNGGALYVPILKKWLIK